MHVWPQIQLWEAHITSAIAALAVLHNSTTTSNSTHAQIFQRSAAKAKALISTGLARISGQGREAGGGPTKSVAKDSTKFMFDDTRLMFHDASTDPAYFPQA